MTNFIYQPHKSNFRPSENFEEKKYINHCILNRSVLLLHSSSKSKNEKIVENCKHLSSLYSMFTPDAVNCKLQMLKGYSRIRPLAFLWLYSWRTRKFRKIQCKKYYDDICLSSFFYIVALFVYEFQLTVLQSQRYYYQQTESLLKEFIENTTTNDSGEKTRAKLWTIINFKDFLMQPRRMHFLL